jgi:hypothetical protein
MRRVASMLCVCAEGVGVLAFSIDCFFLTLPCLFGGAQSNAWFVDIIAA